jgi:hypothetical protein
MPRPTDNDPLAWEMPGKLDEGMPQRVFVGLTGERRLSAVAASNRDDERHAEDEDPDQADEDARGQGQVVLTLKSQTERLGTGKPQATSAYPVQISRFI